MENLNLTAASFDFDNMVSEVGKDPFAASSDKYAEDNRFYKLTKDKEGNGGAIIRFLPDRNRNMIQQVYKINTTIEKNGKKRFVNELSPNTIGAPCPFQEKWQELWNLGDKEESKKFGRAVRFYTNIKVIKDPANPANEGKIFLLDMSGTMKDKIQKIVNPSQADRDLGQAPKELFNPIKGNSFRLVSKKGSNGMINYDSSEALSDITSIYDSVEAAFADIKENTHDLAEFKKPETYLSYEKLQDKLKWVTFADASNAPAVAQVAAVQTAQTVETSELNANVSQPVQTAQVVQEVPANTTSAQPTQETKTQSLDELLQGLV
jgi:hypothetical protein